MQEYQRRAALLIRRKAGNIPLLPLDFWSLLTDCNLIKRATKFPFYVRGKFQPSLFVNFLINAGEFCGWQLATLCVSSIKCSARILINNNCDQVQFRLFSYLILTAQRWSAKLNWLEDQLNKLAKNGRAGKKRQECVTAIIKVIDGIGNKFQFFSGIRPSRGTAAAGCCLIKRSFCGWWSGVLQAGNHNLKLSSSLITWVNLIEFTSSFTNRYPAEIIMCKQRGPSSSSRIVRL